MLFANTWKQPSRSQKVRRSARSKSQCSRAEAFWRQPSSRCSSTGKSSQRRGTSISIALLRCGFITRLYPGKSCC